jgi:hypothetical protein
MHPDAIPPPPRPLTSIAARRAWTEPSVRLWWLMALAVLAMILAYAADRLWDRHVENRLIANGLPLAAKVLGTPDHHTPGQTADPGDAVSLTISWRGQATQVVGALTRPSTIGNTIAIRVDSSDPRNWTDQTEPVPLANALFVGLLLLPIVPLLAAVAAVRRRGMTETWQLGELALAVVTDRRQVPIAPLSYAVRCSLPDGGDRRLRTVYVPPAGRLLGKGDALWLILPPGRGRPVAAMWFT